MTSTPDTPGSDVRADFRARAAAKRQFFALYHRCKRPEVKPEHAAFMATGDAVAVRHADEPLEVRSWGAGPAVVLAHGMFGSGGMFRSLIPVLVERGYRAVAFDAPGHGASAGAFAHADEIADALLDVEEAVGPLAGVVGHSLGAVWSLNALRAGLRAPRLVCLSMPIEASMAVNLHVQKESLEPGVAAHLRRLLAGFAPPHPLSIATQLEIPTLLVHDRDDPLVPFEHAEKLMQSWPGAIAMWTSKLGHFHGLKAPHVAAAVADFLAGAPVADASRSAP